MTSANHSASAQSPSSVQLACSSERMPNVPLDNKRCLSSAKIGSPHRSDSRCHRNTGTAPCSTKSLAVKYRTLWVKQMLAPARVAPRTKDTPCSTTFPARCPPERCCVERRTSIDHTGSTVPRLLDNNSGCAGLTQTDFCSKLRKPSTVGLSKTWSIVYASSSQDEFARTCPCLLP